MTWMLNPLGWLAWIQARAHHRGLHGHGKVSHQRALSLFMTVFGAIRSLFWLSMMVQQLLGVGWVVDLVHNVSFVAFISFYANCATDFGTMTSGFAALFSADSHHDAETTRDVLSQDTQNIISDISALALLQPGPKAQHLAAEIANQLKLRSGAPQPDLRPT